MADRIREVMAVNDYNTGNDPATPTIGQRCLPGLWCLYFLLSNRSIEQAKKAERREERKTVGYEPMIIRLLQEGDR